jgi:hypothetical protein
MGEKILLSVGCDNMSMPLVEKGESPARGAGIDRLPQSVEYKHWLIE